MISSISISKSLSGIGLGGIVTQQLSATVYTDFPFNGGDIVTVIGFSGLPEFFVDGQNLGENSISITAYDKCRKLSQPFDYSSLQDGVDKNGDPVFITASADPIIEMIAKQCGFSIVYGTGELLVTELSPDFYKGASCNSILENLASASGCFICCDSGDALRLQRIGNGISSAIASENSKVIIYPKKEFLRLVVSGDKSEVYDIGSGSVKNIYEISNSLITENIAGSLAEKILPFEYVPVNFNAILNGNVDPYGTVTVGNNDYMVTNISINLCADGAVANVSTPVLPESSAVYNNLLNRRINQRIAVNKIYGNTQISGSDGLKFTDNDGNSYGFSTSSGGVTEYDGAMMDKTMPTEISEKSTMSSGETKQLINYGDKTYSLTYKSEKNGKKTNIKLTEVTKE